MRRARRAWGCCAALLSLAVVALSPEAAAQDDYSDKPFGVRLRPAFLRFIEVSSAGGASVANRWSAAVNPAAADWNAVPSPRGLILSPYYSHIAFDEGTRLHLAGESFTWSLGELGTLLPSVVQIRSNEARDSAGLEFDYRVDYAQLQWAKRWGEWAVGLTGSVGKAEITQDLGPLRVSDTEADTYRFRAGVLHQPAERWLAGCIVEYGFSPYETDALAMTPFGPVPVEIDGTERGFIIRPGVSYEYADYSCVYADYQYGRYSNQGDHLRSHWWVVGVDHRLLEWLWVRGSAFIDRRGNASASCGLGAYFSRRCSLDIGYQYDPLPELQPEFGRSHILQVALSARF